MSNLPIVNAAVAVIVKLNSQRDIEQVLLAQRPEGKPWAGWWEFPGGKIEEGENAEAALNRELQEELGIHVLQARPWLTRSFDYPDKTVKLHFFIVSQWEGEAHGREGQLISWQQPNALNVSPMLPANAPIFDALNLPNIYAITNLSETSKAIFFAQLEQALNKGLKLIQIREKALGDSELISLTQQLVTLAKPYGARVLINGRLDLAEQLGVDGVHLSSHQLMQMQVKPEKLLCAASCHNAIELAQAAKLALDFVVLSPVNPTLSHAGAVTLGWGSFAKLMKDYPLPVYALGGMTRHDLVTAQKNGAHGIAMQRAAWLDKLA